MDLGKNRFDVVACDAMGKPVQRLKLARHSLLPFFGQVGKALIGMEACPGAQWLARKLSEMGHSVRIIPAQFVKPFVKSNKNDACDAEAIVEALIRPTMRFVEVKSTAQLDLQALHRIRDRIAANRTQLICQIRAFCLEYGVAIRQGTGMFKIEFTRNVEALAAPNDTAKRLMTIPGVGPIAATALLAAIGNGRQFRKARDLAAWLGLVPRQSSTGGKTTLLGISKRGNPYVRRLIIHRARSCVAHLNRQRDKLGGWIDLEATMHRNKVIVAMANKIARIAWAVLTRPGTLYERIDPVHA